MKPIIDTKPSRLGFLDGLRGWAILLVFVFHSLAASFGSGELKWNGWLRDFNVPPSFLILLPASFGWSGVAVLFVVSGFCIHLSHARSKHKSFEEFFIRRFFRIYPPYFLALAFFAFFFPWTRVNLRLNEGWFQFGSHALLVHNFADPYFFGINGAFWSIATEMQLYLLYPLLLAISARLGWSRTLWLAGAIEIASRSFAGELSIVQPERHHWWLLGGPWSFWFSWSIGASLAEDMLQGRPPSFARHPLWIWPVVAIGSYFVKPLASFSFMFAAIATAVVIARLLSTGLSWRQSPPWLSGHLRHAGIVSYSVYLLHQPILNRIPRVFVNALPSRAVPAVVVFLCCLAAWGAILPVSSFFYRWIELPSIAVGKWVAKKSAPASQPLSDTTSA